MGLSTISRAKRDQTWREDVVTNGIGRVEGIAVDWIAGWKKKAVNIDSILYSSLRSVFCRPSQPSPILHWGCFKALKCTGTPARSLFFLDIRNMSKCILVPTN